MLKRYLPEVIYNAIARHLNFADINEIRMRTNCPLVVCIKNKKYFVGVKGVSDYDNAIICTYEMMQDFVYKLCDNAVYAVNDQLKQGFVTLPKGVRVGICGEVVITDGEIITIKNFQSANIRIPHHIKGCSLLALDYIMDKDFNNTLVVSPAGAGKTTFIRDVVYQLSKQNYCYNVLIADERNEIASVCNGVAEIPLGNFADIYSNCTKEFAFKQGIRSMKPDIFVTDEIDIDRDLQSIIDASNSGVKVLATIHSDNINNLKQKRGFDKIIDDKVFDRYIVLSDSEGPGTLTHIYDGNLKCIYCR
ncbi:MAG: Flp pilus assembly complex ATPase component TadA [Clostridia bacterium]|nr:Flp pilus assembly complex ATPase component TadA [Clostridia bacterium]